MGGMGGMEGIILGNDNCLMMNQVSSWILLLMVN